MNNKCFAFFILPDRPAGGNFSLPQGTPDSVSPDTSVVTRAPDMPFSSSPSGVFSCQGRSFRESPQISQEVLIASIPLHRSTDDGEKPSHPARNREEYLSP